MAETLESALRSHRGECSSGAKNSGAGRNRKYFRASALSLGYSALAIPEGVEEKATKPRKAYYPGFTLLRIAAAFGVIQFHTGAQAGPCVDGFRALMIQERVPTFMLMALFLTVGRQIDNVGPGRLFRRLRQLVVPLVAWTLIYDGCRFALHGLAGNWQSAMSPFLNPADQLLGKGWHLYFLAWLATGTVVAYLLAGVTRRLSARFGWQNWVGSAVIGTVALIASCAIEVFGGLANPASRVSSSELWVPEQGVMLLSGLADYALSALPYAAIALMIHAVRLTSLRPPARLFMVLGIGAMLGNFLIAHWAVVYPHLTSWVGATCGLVFGLSIPRNISFPSWVDSAARASYGIFLSHVLGLEAYGRIWAWISNQPAEHLEFVPFVAIVLLTFLSGWFVTLQLQRFTFTRRVLLGAN